MKKNKLNAVVASILSLGLITCSGSAFASHSGKFNKMPMNMGSKKDDSDSFDDVVKLFMAAGWLYTNEGIKIERILRELRMGKLGEITEESYRLPTGREFSTYMVANRGLMDKKISYWHDLIHKYNLEREMDILVELLKTADNSLKKFEQAWPGMLLHLKLKQPKN